MGSELILTILAGGFLFFICKWAGDKRAQKPIVVQNVEQFAMRVVGVLD